MTPIIIAVPQPPAWPAWGSESTWPARRAGTRFWLRRAMAWAATPGGGVTVLILVALLARLVFAASLGLGNDESYMVASGRTLRLGYFDHPPMAWWMAWAAQQLAGSDAAVVVRLPFLLTFALTTCLMFRLTAALFSPAAGVWAAVMLNLAPVFGLTTGSWVLPDGPLLAALLGAALCLFTALRAKDAAAWGWWLAAGACAGLALFSKYTAILSLLGVVLYLVTDPAARPWLRRPQPYAAALVALGIFAPVLVWNAAHGWASLLFQAGRAGGGRWHLFGPLTTLSGEALFLLPWLWVPLIACLWFALRSGPAARPSWLLACLAAPPILLFEAVSLRSHVLFHWAAPGYLMLFPLLGEAVGRRYARSRPLRLAITATGIFVLCGAALVGSEARFNWLPMLNARLADPDVEAVDWTFFATDIAARDYLARPGLVIAGTRWHDAGKLDYALKGRLRVMCLGADQREYGITARGQVPAGADVLIVAPHTTPAEIARSYGVMFASIEVLPPSMVLHAGRLAMALPLYLGRGLRVAR